MNELNIGKIVKERRIQLGMTQDQLAELSELSINFLSKFENQGKQNISILTLVKLATALRLQPADLLEGIPNSSEPQSSSREQLLIKRLHTVDKDSRTELISAFMELINIVKKQ